MATRPRLFLGLANSAALWRYGDGYLDGPTSDGADPPVYTGGEAFDAKARGVRVAPAGPENECVFVLLYFVATWTMGVDVRLTPVLDGVAYDGTGGTTDERVTLELEEQDEPVTRRFVIALTIPLLVATVERGRFAMRGTWFQADVETVSPLAAGDLIFEVSVLEFEPVEDTLTPTT